MPIILFLGSYLGGYALAKRNSHKKQMARIAEANHWCTPGSFMSLLKHTK